MEKFKGTKGKWHVHKGSHYFSVKYEENKRGVINFFMISEDYKGSHSLVEECEGNALLVSKAPEMLDLLEQIVGHHKNIGVHNWITEEAEKLIKEATEI